MIFLKKNLSERLTEIEKQLCKIEYSNPSPDIIGDFDFQRFCHGLSRTICSCMDTMKYNHDVPSIIKKLDEDILQCVDFDLSKEIRFFTRLNQYSNLETIKRAYKLTDEEAQVCLEHAPELIKTICSQAKNMLEDQMVRKESLLTIHDGRAYYSLTKNMIEDPMIREWFRCFNEEHFSQTASNLVPNLASHTQTSGSNPDEAEQVSQVASNLASNLASHLASHLQASDAKSDTNPGANPGTNPDFNHKPKKSVTFAPGI